MLPTKLYTGVCLLLVAVHINENNALVEPLDDLPRDLQWYLDVAHSAGNLTQVSGKLVFWAAMNQYTSEFSKYNPELTPQQAAYLERSLEDAIAPLCASAHWRDGKRVKRQAPGRRIRKEIRAMTDNERRRYFAALNGMKTDRSLPPNVYDFLAGYHTGTNVNRAHFGPAFPSWHRLYLWIFEYFLRLQDPTVAIPYWASVLDNDMRNPTQSVIWSSEFYGNGVGAIRTGPFQNWRRINPQTMFRRNVQGGELFTHEGINRILSRNRNFEILYPTAQPGFNFELQHAGAHIFVGGTMNNLNTAAFDPIFFSHHCFVDEIWERFRNGQPGNPASDFHFDASDPRFNSLHAPTETAGFTGLDVFTGILDGPSTWTQNLGYLNDFSNFITYDPVPNCTNSCANSPYLYCDFSVTPEGRCVSITIADIRRNMIGPISRVRRYAPNNFHDDGNQQVCQRRTFINDIDDDWLGRYGPQPGPPAGPSTDTWAYIPVKVVSKRPEEYKEFIKYSLYSQGTSAQFAPNAKLFYKNLQKKFHNCEKFQGSVGKITLVSYGLNYRGYSEEYALTDNRLGVAEASGFIPVKMPTHNSPSEAIIGAFDSCGRVCTPYIKKASSNVMVTEGKFSGGIRVSYIQPKQFSDSYADAMLNIWDVPSQSSSPQLNYDNIPVSFFCEYTDDWIWESVKAVPEQNHAMPVQSHAVPAYNHAVPEHNHAMPVQSHAMPVHNHARPVQSHTMPVQRHAMPVNNHASHIQNHAMPVQSHTMPEQSHAMPVQDHARPVQKHAMPVQDHAMPVQKHLQRQATPVQGQGYIHWTEEKPAYRRAYKSPGTGSTNMEYMDTGTATQSKNMGYMDARSAARREYMANMEKPSYGD